MTPIFETRDTCMYFGGLKAVDHVSIKVEKGEVFGIIGPNGAGKTTFFNVCSGSYVPTGGTVTFDGKDITRLKPDQIVKCGIARTFQNIKLFGNMSVLENVKIGFNIHTKTNLFDAIVHTKRYHEDEKRLEEQGRALLERLDLSQYADTKASNLAYGVQRRVEIARALATDPKILMLDEPAAGMNPQETEALLQFVKKLNQRGLTVMLIEHDMKFVMNICDHIAVLNYGKKICEGVPEEVKNNQEVIDAYFGKPLNLGTGGAEYA
ncbi:MAG: ABC transporter ATP-binding protein [Faecousia sp.]